MKVVPVRRKLHSLYVAPRGTGRSRLVQTVIVLRQGNELITTKNEHSQFQFRPIQADVYRALMRFFLEIEFDVDKVPAASADRCNNPRDTDSAAFLLCLSLVSDLANWGAEFEFYESQLNVTVPHIGPKSTDPEIRDRIRVSLMRLKGETENYSQPVTPDEAFEFVRLASPVLVPAEDSNSDESRIFRSGVSTWSMPYRTREGRSKRFVLYGDIGARRTSLGILEIGDDAPHNPPRDRAMGFTRRKSDFADADLRRLADRFWSIRKCLLPDGLPTGYAGRVQDLIPDIQQFREAGRGRQGTLQEISKNKRLTYLYRLVAAEAACRGEEREEANGFSEGLRVLRDLTIPRVNVEMVICGALPPFGPFRVGKLVASMAGHPYVRSFVDRDFGVIAKSVFDTEKLKHEIPSCGALIVTTKGLYPGHSSQYNAVSIPGHDGARVRLRKLGNTDGKTASHLSDQTMRLANRTIDELDGKRVSRTFGAGGAKRQRTIAQAMRALGLSSEICLAQISRPVYGVSLVGNLENVILFNDSPDWLASPFEAPTVANIRDYEANAAALWRARWLDLTES